MKLLKITVVLIMFAILAACTPMIYGVPVERWDLMSEKERIVAMEAYKERQIAYQKAAAERARIRAEQREALRQQQLQREAEEQARLANMSRVDLIYYGKTGSYGDLLDVSLQGGKIRLNGKKRGYHGVSFKIADGEVRAVPIYYSKGRKADLYVFYKDRHLWFDTSSNGQGTRRAGHLVFDNSWGSGRTYNINSHGARDMRGVQVSVQVVPIRHGRRFDRHQPPVIIKERIVQAPPQVIVKEKIVQAPPKVIIKEKIVEAPPQVIIKEKVVQVPSRDTVEKRGGAQKEGSRPRKGIGDDNTNSELTFAELKEKRRKEREEAKQVRQEVRDRAERSENKKNEKSGTSKETLKIARVVLNGGTLLIDGKHRPFNPVKFNITEGETKAVTLSGGERSATQKAFSVNMVVSFKDGQIYLDGKAGDRTAYRLSARNGNKKVSTKGAASMQKVSVKIEID